MHTCMCVPTQTRMNNLWRSSKDLDLSPVLGNSQCYGEAGIFIDWFVLYYVAFSGMLLF